MCFHRLQLARQHVRSVREKRETCGHAAIARCQYRIKTHTHARTPRKYILHSLTARRTARPAHSPHEAPWDAQRLRNRHRRLVPSRLELSTQHYPLGEAQCVVSRQAIEPLLGAIHIDRLELCARRSRPVSRNLLAAGIISNVLDYLRGFAATGFQPMVRSFNEHHAYHGKPCRLLLGNDVVSGIVQGVSDHGELLLASEGKTLSYTSGEVSLRSD